jgi:hypothetical protein
METGDPLAGTERNEVSAKNNGFFENRTIMVFRGRKLTLRDL